MASSIKLAWVLFFASSLLFQETLGEIICEELPTNVCSFSISSSGKRCLLETSNQVKNGQVNYQCRTSNVVVGGMAEHIETDACIKACGVDRKMVGISSDSLLEPQLIAKLCSADCHQKCPNIVDLYFNLAAGEGVFLPDLCQKQKTSPHRAMIELLSSGAASGPAASKSKTSDDYDKESAPAPAASSPAPSKSKTAADNDNKSAPSPAASSPSPRDSKTTDDDEEESAPSPAASGPAASDSKTSDDEDDVASSPSPAASGLAGTDSKTADDEDDESAPAPAASGPAASDSKTADDDDDDDDEEEESAPAPSLK